MTLDYDALCRAHPNPAARLSKVRYLARSALARHDCEALYTLIGWVERVVQDAAADILADDAVQVAIDRAALFAAPVGPMQ
jgi:hypothetical protein